MKNNGALLLQIILILVVAAPIAAQDLSHIPAAFVDVGYGARPMGMGGAFVGLADDRNAVVWNPAGLLKSQGSGAAFMWAKQLGFVPYNYLCYSRPMGDDYRTGGALIYSGDEVMSETTALVSIAASLRKYGRYFQDIAVAANLKFRQASYGNNSDGDPDRVTGDASGFGLDLGFMWQASPKVSVGMLLRDLFNGMSWKSSQSGTYSESIPAEFVIGASYKHTRNSVIAVDYRKALYDDVDNRIMVGFEQRIFRFIALRTGWGRNVGGEEPNQEIAFGLGVGKSMKNFDFAFDFAFMLNDLQNTPRAGVTLDW